MSTLSSSSLLVILDSLAKGYQLAAAGIGVTGGDANTLAKGAANNVATLIAIADVDVQADLVAVFEQRAASVLAPALALVAFGGASLQAALDRHYGGAGGLNRALTAADVRVHPDLRKLSLQVDQVNAFAPEAVVLGSFAVTGSGAGTFTAGAAIDTSLYGKANVVVRTSGLIGVAAIVATLTLTTLDGASETKQVTVPAGTAGDTNIDVGVHGTDMYIACALVTITGGTAGDGFTVRTEVERTLDL